MKRVVYRLLVIIGIGSFWVLSGQKVMAVATQTDVAITIKEAPPSPSIRGHPQTTTNARYSRYPQTNDSLSSWWWQPVGVLLCLLVGTRYLFYKQKMERRQLL
ncbi:hypothetical protein OPL79_002114 [Enterococcus faecalis]|uniref:hypothetical protein n=1 Tax=Enterococcus faecalis TaxID=1351 RepID=UPI003DD4DF61|nr:hypothetical protein [Enterococcus faecalis]